jgi:hypothetical protein
MTMLEGSNEWPVMLNNGCMAVQNVDSMTMLNVEATPSLRHISTCPVTDRIRLCESCICLCLAETNVNLDFSEYAALVQLIAFLCSNQIDPLEGISVKVFSSYLDTPTLWKWNACHFKLSLEGDSMLTRTPQSLIERRFTGNFRALSSIRFHFGTSSNCP